MNEEMLKIRKDIERLHTANVNEVIPLYPGIELCYLTLSSDPLSVRHKAMPYMIQINYCKAGQMVWEMKNGNRIYLNPGDFFPAYHESLYGFRDSFSKWYLSGAYCLY